MSRRSHISDVYIPLLTLWSDVISIEIAFLLSYWLRFFSPIYDYFPIDGQIPPISGYITLSLMVIPVWLLIFQSRKMYRARRVVFVFDEFFLITKMVTFGVIFAFGLIFFYRVFPYSRLVFVLIWFISIILITFNRYLILKLEKNLYNRGIALKPAFIIGNNENASGIYNNFVGHRYTGYKILGYLQDDKYAGPEYMEGKNLLGYYSEIDKIIRKYSVETILVALPSSENDDLYDLMKKCEGINVEFMLMPDFLEMITSSVRIQEIDGIPFLKLKDVPMNPWNTFLKRAFDLAVSFMLLLIISPVFLIIILLIKLTSKGPVFYYQERVSLAGKKFNMIKFRSMITNAEEKTGVVMARVGDDRYTPIGKFLRKYSVDELPQFINVLKGDMSIVGPRPEREHFINIMKDKIPKYLERHRVKCGITGWAQVNGLRGQETSMEKRIEYDIYYIENWSIIFDLKIIIKTIREVLFSKVAF